MPVIFHRLATVEYVSARRWYALRSADAEARFVAAVAAAVGRVDETPSTGSPLHGPYRWVRVKRFPYLLHYEQIGPATMRVYAVAHASRRPGYWLRRTRRP